MTDPTIGRACDKNIGSFHGIVGRSPSDVGDRHLISISLLVEHLAQCICNFTILSVVNSHGSITISCCNIFVSLVISGAEAARGVVAQLNFLNESKAIGLEVENLFNLCGLTMVSKHI